MGSGKLSELQVRPPAAASGFEIQPIWLTLIFNSLTGIGNHWGGSCQVGFSVDAGKTFQVATSYQGNCPHRNGGESADGQTFDFTVPADIPTGDVVFAW